LLYLYGLLTSLLSKGQSGLLLLIRLYIGYQCAVAGYGHFTHFHRTVNFFASINIPAPALNVAVSVMTELLGGLLLLLGGASRLVALVLTGNFIVAILAPALSNSDSHEQILHFWNHQDVILTDTAFPFLVTAVLVLIFGPGWYSIDGELISRKGNPVIRFTPHMLLFLGTIATAFANGVGWESAQDKPFFAPTAAGLIILSFLMFLLTRLGSIAATGPKP